MLSYPELYEPFIVGMDSSGKYVSSVLTMKKSYRKIDPIYVSSRNNNSADLNN